MMGDVGVFCCYMLVRLLVVMEPGLVASSASSARQPSDTRLHTSPPSRQPDSGSLSASGPEPSPPVTSLVETWKGGTPHTFPSPPRKDHDSLSASRPEPSQSSVTSLVETLKGGTPHTFPSSLRKDHDSLSASRPVPSQSPVTSLVETWKGGTPHTFPSPPRKDHDSLSASRPEPSQSPGTSLVETVQGGTPHTSPFPLRKDFNSLSASEPVPRQSPATKLEESTQGVTAHSSLSLQHLYSEKRSWSKLVSTSQPLEEMSEETRHAQRDPNIRSATGSVKSESPWERSEESLQGIKPKSWPLQPVSKSLSASHSPRASQHVDSVSRSVTGESLLGRTGETPEDTTPHYPDSEDVPALRSVTTEPGLETPECAPITHILTRQNGTIVWEHRRGRCNQPTTWSVQTPPGHGVVVELQEVLLSRLGVLTVASEITQPDQSVKTEIERRIMGGAAGFSYAPLLIRGNVSVTVKAWYDAVNALHNSSSSIKYTVYPLARIPDANPRSTESWDSRVEYNCSTGFPVPEALRCDGVKHCADNEDEKDCEYTQHGCGDWLPYNNHCIKLKAMSVYKSGETQARIACHPAGLAVIPDDSGKSLAANLLRKSGLHLAWIELRKVDPVTEKIKHFYRYLWQWGFAGSPIAYEELEMQRKDVRFSCAALAISPSTHLKPVLCEGTYERHRAAICMRPNPKISATPPRPPRSVNFFTTAPINRAIPTKKCFDSSRVQLFHQCQWNGHFSDRHYSSSTRPVLQNSWSPNNFRLFKCRYGPPIHYSLVCDGTDDCPDDSDEQDCLIVWSAVLFHTKCATHQFPPYPTLCDGVRQCFDGYDEQSCEYGYCHGGMVYCEGEAGCFPPSYVQWFPDCITRKSLSQDDGCELCRFGPLVVHLDGYGMSTFSPVGQNNQTSLEGFFLCDNGMYIPSYLLRNGEQDCFGGEDETIPAENIICPGFYRCQYYGNCVHPDLVCDGINHCPYKDDERYCGYLNLETILPGCTCEGFACLCPNISSVPFNNTRVLYLRYLDVSGNNRMFVHDLIVSCEGLYFLNASHCRLSNVSFERLRLLRVLDLSFNDLRGLASLMLGNLSKLTHLNISGNPLVSTLDSTFTAFLKQTGLVRLEELSMVNTGVRTMADYALRVLTQLVKLDIRGNAIENPDINALGGLNNLRVLKTDDSKLYCTFIQPQMSECHAPVDELSSCSDLLRLDFFRVSLWGICVLITVCNGGVLVYAVKTGKETLASPYRFLVANLAAADLLMGIYMAIIGAADEHFRGAYFVSETEWRQSGTCITAGFLAFVSSEVSAFIICLITLDRFLKVCFPFKPQLHMGPRSCVVMCGVAWLCGLCLAAVPLIAQLQFYGVSGICLPLPITLHSFSGHGYSFGVFVMMNFVLFVLIGAGQAAIYLAIRAAAKTAGSKRQQRDTAIARSLFLVVLTDFCCWFPVGVLGIMAFCGVAIPLEVNVWVAIFVMPVNSALNPSLYTLIKVRQKWAEEKTKKKTKYILENLQAEILKLPPGVMEPLMVSYLRSNKAVTIETLSSSLDHQEDGAATTSM